MAVFSCAGDARAEFLKTADGVYQSTALTDKVVVSYSMPGVFIYQGSQQVPLQTFSPSLLKDENSHHAFVKYDPEQKKYDAMFVGEKQYDIRGSFSMRVGSLRVTIDNSNPYLSIVSEPSGNRAPAVLGLMGTDVVVNFSGNEAVALLEGNQFNQYSNLIEPYVVNHDNVTLKGEPVSTKTIGLDIGPAHNVCMRKGAVYLSQNDLKKIRATDNLEERSKLLEKGIKKSRESDFTKGLIMLRITAEQIISVDYQNALVKLIRPIRTDDNDLQICEVEQVNLS